MIISHFLKGNTGEIPERSRHCDDDISSSQIPAYVLITLVPTVNREVLDRFAVCLCALFSARTIFDTSTSSILVGSAFLFFITGRK